MSGLSRTPGKRVFSGARSHRKVALLFPHALMFRRTRLLSRLAAYKTKTAHKGRFQDALPVQRLPSLMMYHSLPLRFHSRVFWVLSLKSFDV